MQIQEIDEAVEVLLRVGGGKIIPEQIVWGSTVYHVRTVNNTWRQKFGQGYKIHIACMTREETAMEIVIDPVDLSCRLARMSLAHD